MRRAIETAALLEMPIPPIRAKDLNETDAGDVAMWPRVVFDAQFADFWSPFDPARPFPGGESHMDLYHRVNQYTAALLGGLGEEDKMLMVAHGGTISSIFHQAFNVPMIQFSRFKAQNASLSILRFRRSEAPELVAFNLRPPYSSPFE